jgi:hypothetical protein
MLFEIAINWDGDRPYLFRVSFASKIQENIILSNL